MDTKAFFKLSYGLYVVTTRDGENQSGCVANTMTQVTSDPAQVCITLNKNNYTTDLIQKSGVLNVSVLTEEVPMETIRHFGFQSGRNVHKFADVEAIPCSQDIHGVYYLTRYSAASFACQVKQRIDVGTHVMFVCEVKDARTLSASPVLTYANYHLLKKGTTPKNAPSYIEEKQKKGWRCDVCGYIYEGETLPEDFVCPVCKVDRSHFQKI